MRQRENLGSWRALNFSLRCFDCMSRMVNFTKEFQDKYGMKYFARAFGDHRPIYLMKCLKCSRKVVVYSYEG